MILKKLPYFFRKALSNIRYSMLVNLVTISTISVAILIFSTFVMIIFNLTNLVSRFEDDVHIVAYLDDEFVGGNENIKKNLLKLNGIEKVWYQSKENALKVFKESLGENDLFLKDIQKNPLPASFELRLKEGYKDRKNIEAIAAALRSMGIFSDVSYGQEWLEHFHNFMNILKVIGLAVGGGFLFAAVFIISNTIKLTIFVRREEIDILRLVGATNSFIKAPFYIEGLIQGFVGSVISIIGLYFLYLVFMAKVQTLSLLGVNSTSMPFLPPKFLILLVAFGTLLGLMGSYISLGEIFKRS